VRKAHVSPADCLGGYPGLTNYAGYDGAMLPSATNATYTINVVSNPGNAGISFFFANSGRAGAVNNGISETFTTPDNSGVFVYASNNGNLGYFPVQYECPLKFCQTSYGWLLQIDPVGDGSYSTLATFVQQ
jgi:hypothetical protein